MSAGKDYSKLWLLFNSSLFMWGAGFRILGVRAFPESQKEEPHNRGKLQMKDGGKVLFSDVYIRKKGVEKTHTDHSLSHIQRPYQM